MRFNESIVGRCVVVSCVALVLTLGLAVGPLPDSAFAQNAQTAETLSVAVGPQYDTTHVYVAPEDFDRFVASLIATFGGATTKQGVFTVTPTQSSTMSQLVLTPVGTVSVFGFKTPIPYAVPSTDLLSIASFLWAFVPGMLVAEFQQRGVLNRPLSTLVPVAGLVLIGTSVVLDLPPYLDIAAAAGSGLLVASIVSRRAGESRFQRASIALGAVSYSIYLWHEAIIDLVDRPVPSWGGAVLALAVTAAIAAVVYVVVEGPAIRLGHRVALVRRGRPSIPVVEAPGALLSPEPPVAG